MSETRVVTPGNFMDLAFGFFDGLIGSIDDNNLKGSLITTCFQDQDGVLETAMSTAQVNDFIGQQVLIGETVYFLRDFTFTTNQWVSSPNVQGSDMEDGFNASENVSVIYDFRQEQYTTPELVTPYGNQGTLVDDTVNIDLNPNFSLANTVTATNLPPGLSETDGVVTGTLTDNTGPFEVLVTATNSLGTTETTFTWNTYRQNTTTRIVTPGVLGGVFFGYATGFIGSIDDDNLKGSTIAGVVQQPIGFIVEVVPLTPIDFIGQQILTGETTNFLKDIQTFDVNSWTWSPEFAGTDLEQGFNSSTPVPITFNINGVNTFFNTAINSDINTPIPFPSHFDNR